MIVRTRAYARAGLIGNPSDGYFGKTISVILRNFCAEVTCYESPKLVVAPSKVDNSTFESLDALVHSVRVSGYYGGVRLLKATLKRFADYCAASGIELEDKNCTLEYASDIPLRVGMGGSSAIVIATLRALSVFYGVEFPLTELANLALSVETEELEIGAGLQDRVIQCYEGCVFMDFDRALMEKQGHGRYVRLDPSCLPNLFVAFDARVGEGTEVFHNNLRALWEEGDATVREAMTRFADLTEEARRLLESGQGAEIGPLMDANYDLRASISHLNPDHVRMVEVGRKAGSHVKFAGSGGAVIGDYEDEEHFGRIAAAYATIGAKTIKPDVRGRSDG